MCMPTGNKKVSDRVRIVTRSKKEDSVLRGLSYMYNQAWIARKQCSNYKIIRIFEPTHASVCLSG